MVDADTRSRASFRIYSQQLTVDEITEALRLQPNKSFVMGSKAAPEHPKSYVYPQNVWLIQSSINPEQPLQVHIASLLDLIESKLEVLVSLQDSCTMDIFCGFSSTHGQGGFIFSPELIKRLAKLPLKLTVDLFPPTQT